MDDTTGSNDDSRGNSSSDTDTSLTLLELARRRDDEAWRQLVDQYGPRIHRWATRSGLGPDDALDVVQEVLQAVLRNLDRFQRRKPQAFRRWLRRITSNKVKDHRRRTRRIPRAKGGTTAFKWIQQQHDPAADDGSVADESTQTVRPSADPGICPDAVDRVKARVKTNTWEAFWRTAVEGQPPEDVAAELGMSVASVWKARSRVTARLRSEASKQREK